MEFNKELTDVLDDYGINRNEALTVLLILYYNIEYNNQIFNDSMIKTLSQLNFIRYDFQEKKYFLTVPLFGTSTSDEWVKEYMNKFAKVNPERRGDKQSVIKNYSKLQQEYKDVSTDDILKATDIYLASLKRQGKEQYCKKSHKFLWDRDNGYEIITYLEMLKNKPNAASNSNSLMDIL